MNKTNLTPGRKVLVGANAAALENSIIQTANKKLLQYSLFWASVNFCILSIIVYDLSHSCTFYVSFVQYLEYCGACVLFLNTLYHVWKCLTIHLYNKAHCKSGQPCNPSTPIIRNRCMSDMKTPMSAPQTPMNFSAASWMTNVSANDSQNYPIKSNSWIYSRGSPKSNGVSPITTPRQDTSSVDVISDENSLNTYLKEFEAHEKLTTLCKPEETSMNILSSFWTHPIAKTSKDVSEFLKRCHYQLSTPAATSSSATPKSEDKGSPHGSPLQGMDTWRRLQIDPTVLTEWNANIRMWISQTILTRLIKEFESVDEALMKHGFVDVQIGKVGLDRLRKSAQTGPVLQFIPTLPTLIPFLEVTANQEYLVKRIKELARGGCMSDFKWNSGSSFNAKEWDTTLPTDSAIIMHLFASYMDTQLQPLPSQPDVKAFTGYHFIRVNEKLNINPSTLAIQQCSEYPPYYRVIIREEIFELVKGYNNLFHSILLFLHYVNKLEHGMLGQVNLGRSGVNILWVIQS